MTDKLWHFHIKHPVDITIACDYVNKKFPDRAGVEPESCWSYLDMDAYRRMHYSKRAKTIHLCLTQTTRFG